MAAKKGKDTAQYKAVQVSFANLTGHLDSDERAKTDLTRHFKARGWLDPVVELTSVKLIILVLERIRVTPTEYDSFVAMLEEVVGTDNIVQTLKGSVTCIQLKVTIEG